jgi:hypothetical protein
VAFSVLFGSNRFDSLSMADERIRQAGIFTVSNASVPQCFIGDIAKNIVCTISHPKMDSLKPLEFEMLLAFDQWHRTGLSPIACGIIPHASAPPGRVAESWFRPFRLGAGLWPIDMYAAAQPTSSHG